MQPKPVNYISNRELLQEIQRSKVTYSHFVAPEYAIYDTVVTSLDALTPELVESLLKKKVSNGGKSEIVARVMTDSHIPPETNEKARRRSSNGGWTVKTNFPPFKHYLISEDAEPREVGRSHWRDGLSNGAFCLDHGNITNRLAQMFMMLTEHYSNRYNYRSYSYRDEMRNHAIMHLVQVGLQFDESRSDNPFAFYTQIVKHVFTRILNLERRNQMIRDDLLIMAEVQPSYTRQLDNDLDQRDGYSIHVTGDGGVKKEPKKRGRKPKVKAA